MEIRELLDRILSPHQITQSFSAIVGFDDVKFTLKTTVENPIKFRRYIENQPTNGIIMFSEPGNGKSLFARSLAKEININFLQVKSGEIDSKFYAVASQNLIQIFKVAKTKSPILLFLDEIDGLFANREQDSSSHNKQLVNTLLTELDESRGSVFLCATTNSPWSLDPALIRRLKTIYVRPPTDQERSLLMTKFLAGKAQLGDGDMQVLSKKTEKYSNADIEALINMAFHLNISRVQKAKHFLKKKGPTDIYAKYVPCFCKNPTCGGLNRSLADFPSDVIEFPPITISILEEALAIQKGSKNSNQDKMNNFIRLHGDGIIGSGVKNCNNETFRTRSKFKFKHLIVFTFCVFCTTIVLFLFITFVVMEQF